MDTPFVTGMAAFISALLVFVGAAFLLLSLVVGPRLSYFITASITLAFLLIMAVVWSINPLGPVGRLPEWEGLGAAEDASEIDFGAASQYPDDPWFVADEEDAVQTTQAAELESDASAFVESELAEGNLEGFPLSPQLTIADDSTLLLEQGENVFGATVIEVLPPLEQPELGVPPRSEREDSEEATGGEELEPLGEVTVVMEYDAGNPLGLSRQIAVGTFILLAAHLFGLSRSERAARRRRAEAETAG